jgi:hypothetical protein
VALSRYPNDRAGLILVLQGETMISGTTGLERDRKQFLLSFIIVRNPDRVSSDSGWVLADVLTSAIADCAAYAGRSLRDAWPPQAFPQACCVMYLNAACECMSVNSLDNLNGQSSPRCGQRAGKPQSSGRICEYRAAIYYNSCLAESTAEARL